MRRREIHRNFQITRFSSVLRLGLLVVAVQLQRLYGSKRKGHSSRALIDACIPYERRGDYPPVAESSDKLKAKMREKWRTLLQTIS
jgi:hypothetical protein